MTTTRPPIERWWDHVRFIGANPEDCWTWDGAMIYSTGYGQFALSSRKPVLAHRFAYEHAFGPIPAGFHIDHLCRRRACVNPNHLDAVTPRENWRRGLRGELITECPHGHPYDEENTRYTRIGHRICRTCANGRRRQARQRAR